MSLYDDKNVIMKPRLSVFAAPGHEMRFWDLCHFVQKAMAMDMPDMAVVTSSIINGLLTITIDASELKE